jgi:hypothetical protein
MKFMRYRSVIVVVLLIIIALVYRYGYLIGGGVAGELETRARERVLQPFRGIESSFSNPMTIRQSQIERSDSTGPTSNFLDWSIRTASAWSSLRTIRTSFVPKKLAAVGRTSQRNWLPAQCFAWMRPS